MEYQIPDLSVLIDGTDEELEQANEWFKIELKNETAKEQTAKYITDIVTSEFPEMPFHKAWEKFKEIHQIE